MTTDGSFPLYSDLPTAPTAPYRNAWGVFGERDQLGALGRITEDDTRAAASLVRRGAVFPLDLPLELPDPPILGRRGIVHSVGEGPSGLDDRYDDFHPQGSSQWDALSHARHPEHGFYNGWSRDEVLAGAALGVDGWAAKGIAGRFTLIDVERSMRSHGEPLDQTARIEVTSEHLERALDDQGTTLEPDSILLLHFGWMRWYRLAGDYERARIAANTDFSDIADDQRSFFPCPGLSQHEQTAAWLWDHGVAGVAADNPALEAMPFSRATTEQHLHYRLIALLGIAIGELWDLTALADDCADDGVYEGLLTSAPLHKRGGTGSTANALAVK